jgi:phosphatidyl-myo-inositol dimannoside synthase
MKILALMPDAYSGFGGIAQYNRDLLDALLGSPKVEKIVALSRHFPDPKVRFKPPSANFVEHFLPGNMPRYVMAALGHGMNLRPDVILCGHINLLPVAALSRRIMGGFLVLEAYGIEAWKRLPGVRSWGTKQVDLVIAISRFTREHLMRWSGIAPHRIRVVPNAVHLNDYSSAEKPDYLVQRYGVEGKLVLLTVGRLPGRERYKGHDRIFRLLPKLTTRFPNLVYMIVGDGSDRARLEGVVSTLELDEHVIFTGRISEAEKIDHYNLADAFAMPSTSEGFGFVFLEAAACGLPVLGGSNDGSRDALVDGRLGVMVDCESPDELLQGLEDILQRKKRVPDCLKPFDFPRFSMQIQQLVTSDL